MSNNMTDQTPQTVFDVANAARDADTARVLAAQVQYLASQVRDGSADHLQRLAEGQAEQATQGAQHTRRMAALGTEVECSQAAGDTNGWLHETTQTLERASVHYAAYGLMVIIERVGQRQDLAFAQDIQRMIQSARVVYEQVKSAPSKRAVEAAHDQLRALQLQIGYTG